MPAERKQAEGTHAQGMHTQEWGAGDPLIALHPLALESTAFAGVGRELAQRGLRTIAADLPGFGCTPAPEGVPLTPAVLAQPVLDLARSLERPPLLLGMSMGGRVALEAALQEPEAFRGLVLVAPFLPLKRTERFAWIARRWLDPAWGERIPLEKAWGLLKRLAEGIESLPRLEHDWLARAAARVVYYSSCPATRVAFLSAAREMALDPASGPHSLWSRLPDLRLPATFLWAGRDALIPRRHARDVALALPPAAQVEVACSGHFVSGTHYRCMRHAIALAVAHTLEAERGGAALRAPRVLAPCLADAEDSEEGNRVRAAIPEAAGTAPVPGGPQ